MGASSFTPNYHLPQFAADDKPSWLGDINTAFSDIDLGIEEANVTANNGLSTAQEAFNKINDTLSLLEEQIDKINSLAGEMENFNGFLMPVPEWNISPITENVGFNLIHMKGTQNSPILDAIFYLKNNASSSIQPSNTTNTPIPATIYPIFNINYNIFNIQPGDFATSKNVLFVCTTLAYSITGSEVNNSYIFAVFNGGYTRFAANKPFTNGDSHFILSNLYLNILGKQIIYNPENTQPEEDN